MRRVLVTGAAGYIGSELVRQLLVNGYQVTGLDSLLFGGDALLGHLNHEHFTFIRGDIRNEDDLRRAINGCDSVVHLAAIVGDPACTQDPETTHAVNLVASKTLYDICARDGSVERFVFASTCSNYGRMQDQDILDETSPLNPISVYAETKVAVEEHLLSQPSHSGPACTVLRFSTVYGISSRPRFDLTVNDFVREVMLGKELVVFGEQFWRPYCHVRDLARSCVHVLEANRESVAGEVFGVGDSKENYQKKMLVDEIQKVIPQMVVRFVQKTEDPRDYRVDFTKIRERLGFTISRTVPDGIREIKRVIEEGVLADPECKRYQNT